MLISIYEGIDKVDIALFSFSYSLVIGIFKLGVGSAFASKVLHHVGHAHLKHYVHTALKVKTQANLQCFAILERFAEPYGLVAHRVKVCGAVLALCGHLLSLLLVLVSGVRKAEIHEANQGEQHCNYFNKSFVLHVCDCVIIVFCFSIIS